jgi:hypothetical protein
MGCIWEIHCVITLWISTVAAHIRCTGTCTVDRDNDMGWVHGVRLTLNRLTVCNALTATQVPPRTQPTTPTTRTMLSVIWLSQCNGYLSVTKRCLLDGPYHQITVTSELGPELQEDDGPSWGLIILLIIIGLLCLVCAAR